MNERVVVIDGEQAQILEDVGVELMRQKDDRAMKVLAISLAYKFAEPRAEPKPPSNVYPIVKHAGDNWSRKVGA